MQQPTEIQKRKGQEKSPSSTKPDISNKKIVMGFWHNWEQDQFSGSGYRQGFFRNLPLTSIPQQYNVIAVSFMKMLQGSNDSMPDFKPYTGTDEEFRQQIATLNKQGRVVLISLGGADAHIELRTGDENALAERIISLVTTYGFDGLDIDLEQAAISAKDNQTVIPAALKMVKNHYHSQGQNFIISMAPEFPHLRLGNPYTPYITSLEGYYDFIAPQFYNQGGDGIWVDGIGNLQQNDDSVKEAFLYHLTKSIVTGTNGYIQIPHEKFVIGLPSNNDAANNGYVIDDNAVKNALIHLDQDNLSIKGLMTWSINWDDGRTKSGSPYNWEFITRYGYISDDEKPQPEVPSVPSGLMSTAQTTMSITLGWQSSVSVNPIQFYTLYRNGAPVGSTKILSYTDDGLQPETAYHYQVSATDSKGNNSSLSPALTVQTLPNNSVISDWEAQVWYEDGDKVSYLDNVYCCIMQHTSTIYWTPDKATSLWQRV